MTIVSTEDLISLYREGDHYHNLLDYLDKIYLVTSNIFICYGLSHPSPIWYSAATVLLISTILLSELATHPSFPRLYYKSLPFVKTVAGTMVILALDCVLSVFCSNSLDYYSLATSAILTVSYFIFCKRISVLVDLTEYPKEESIDETTSEKVYTKTYNYLLRLTYYDILKSKIITARSPLGYNPTETRKKLSIFWKMNNTIQRLIRG